MMPMNEHKRSAEGNGSAHLTPTLPPPRAERETRMGYIAKQYPDPQRRNGSVDVGTSNTSHPEPLLRVGTTRGP